MATQIVIREFGYLHAGNVERFYDLKNFVLKNKENCEYLKQLAEKLEAKKIKQLMLKRGVEEVIFFEACSF